MLNDSASLSGVAVQKPRWADPPPQSIDGDVLLDLGKAGSVTAHSLYLQHASDLFADVLACCDGSPEPSPYSKGVLEIEAATAPQLCSCSQSPSSSSDDSPAPKRRKATPQQHMPLPETSRKQALLLLQCLYQHTQPAWADELEIPELLDLAQAAHKFACLAVLHQADRLLVAAVKAEEALVRGYPYAKQAAARAAAWLDAQNAPARHATTQALHLPSLALHVGSFMAMHAEEVDLDVVDVALLGVLQGARQLCRRVSGCP